MKAGWAFLAFIVAAAAGAIYALNRGVYVGHSIYPSGATQSHAAPRFQARPLNSDVEARHRWESSE